jgi:hypothetical protein
MLVDELRDDPAFVDALTRLRGALSLALMASHPNDRKAKYAKVAERLIEVYERLDEQR